MKKYNLISMIREARKNFITESAAVKLADDFETNAEKALADHIKAYPEGVFHSWFAFSIKSIDLATCQCKVSAVNFWADINEICGDVNEYDSWLFDGNGAMPVEALQSFFNELKARGYEVGIDEGSNDVLTVYFSY